jgi:hypothetical protein
VNNIITAADVQQGDKIKVTVTSGDRTTSYEGVADHHDNYRENRRWRTPEDSALWTDLVGAVIELLDRPKPKIELPTGIGATITYTKVKDSYEPKRVAVFNGRTWTSHYPNGEWRDGRNSEALAEWFEHGDAAGLKVLFEGVAK